MEIIKNTVFYIENKLNKYILNEKYQVIIENEFWAEVIETLDCFIFLIILAI